MSFRRIACSAALSSSHRPAHLVRIGLGALMLMAPWFAAASASSAGAESTTLATLAPLRPDTGAITIAAGQDVTLSTVDRIGDQPLAGQKVEWKVVGPGHADLSPASTTTTAQSATTEAGIASTVLHAVTPGSYEVTATAQKNPGCGGAACATWVSTRFAVTVEPGAGAGGDTGSHEGISKDGILGAALIGAAALAVAANSGGHDHANGIVENVHSIAIVSGNNQTGLANGPLAQPLVVHLANNGVSVSQGVHWTASGGAVLSAQTTTSDNSGNTSIQVISVGPGPGPVTVTAQRVDDTLAHVNFQINVNIPQVPTLSIISGDEQTAFTGARVPQLLVVEADVNGTPQPNIPIVWAVASGSASITAVSNGGNTNAMGQSRAAVTFGAVPGPVTITATRNDGTGLSQTFHLTSIVNNSLSIVSGDQQTGLPNCALGQRLVVHAATNNRAAVDVTINWTASGGATLSAPTSLTNNGGDAGIRVTDMGNTLGPVLITATRADDPTATVTFVANIAPPTLTIGGGNNQSGLIGTPAATALTVVLKDGGNQPMGGQTISWSVTSGQATLGNGTSGTDGAGHATMTFNYGASAGPIQIQASAFNGLTTVTFNETATTPGSLTKIAGDNVSGAPNSSIGLTVQIGAPVSAGVPIQFTVLKGAATVSQSLVPTNGAGQASTNLNLGATPGAVQVLAQVSGGGPSVTFNDNITGSLVPTSLSIVSGNLQVITPNTASKALVVKLTAAGAPLANEPISWSTSSGTLSASSVTDATGKTSITVTPTTTGPITVTAQFMAVAQYTGSQVAFSENTTIAAISTLTSNDQSVAVALDTACTSLQALTNRTQQQQDLLNQCLALSVSSSVSTAATTEALHQLNPTVAETQSHTATTASTAQFDNLAGRMNALRGGAHGVSFAGLAFNNASGSLPLFDIGASLLAAADPKGKEAEASSFSRWGLFASGQIGREDSSAQGSTPGYNMDSSGITIGVDYRVKDNLVLGGAIGYTRQTTDLAASQGNLKMSGWSLSGYGTWYGKNDWYVDGSFTWGNNTFDSLRHIDYTLPLPGGALAVVDQIATANSGGNNWGGSLAVGRDFHNKALSYGFYGKLQYNHQSFDAFQEQLDQTLPGSGLGLRVNSRSNTSTASVLGAKLDYNRSTNWGVLVPHAEVEWQHEFRTDPGAFTATFLDDPTNTPIVIRGDATDSDFFRLGVGMSFVMTQGRSAFVLYDRTIGRQGITQYNVSLGLRVEF